MDCNWMDGWMLASKFVHGSEVIKLRGKWCVHSSVNKGRLEAL